MKILSNKKYHELLLKSCKGMFGAVTDDMLLRSNAFIAKEKEQLQDELQRKDNNWNELKEWLNEPHITYNFDASDFGIEKIECVSVKDTLDKIKELEERK